MAKYIFLAGGAFSGNGKGVAISSLAKLMQMRSHSVQVMKLEPYLSSVDSLSPCQHGEVYLTDNIVSDLDLGTYARFLNINMTEKNLYTSGMLYKEIFRKQDNGDYPGQTIQVVPHLVNLIEEKIKALSKEAEIVFCEIGGTIGDIEGKPYFEFLRRFKNKYRNDVIVAVLAPIVRVSTDGEPKTKPIQNCIKELNFSGLYADLLICRTDGKEVPANVFEKISDMTGISRDGIFVAPDTDSVYKVPLIFHKQHMDDYIADLLYLQRKPCRIHKYRELINKLDEELPTIQIGIIGKYDHGDAYLSVKEALSHAALSKDVKVDIKFIPAEVVEKSEDLTTLFSGLNGFIVPGGFSIRGIEGKILAIEYARKNKVPFLGICLGLQTMFLEYCRNVLGIKDANSQEFDMDTKNPVVHFLPGQEKLVNKTDTMRLGAYDCELVKDTLAHDLYKKKMISERHRHRLEINPEYVKPEMDLKVSGINPQSKLIEIMEMDKDKHPFMIASQFHCEFKSYLMEPAPLFIGLVNASLDYKNKK